MSQKSRKAMIQEMLDDEPNDPELGYMLAMEHISEGDDAGAAEVFKNLIAVAPSYPPAYHMAGRTLQRLGRLSEAKAVLTQGIPIALKAGNQHAAGEMQEVLENLE